MPSNKKYSKATRIEDEEVVTSSKKKSATTKKRRKTKKKKRHSYFLWLACIIALIPCVAVVYILITAMYDTGEPINGDRFRNDLNPAITETMQGYIENDIRQLDGVENVTLNLKAATLRIIIDMNDDKVKEDALAIGQSAVDIINSYAPIETYFSSYGVSKMYDFEISVYDILTADIKPTVHVIYTKNGVSDKVITQVVTDPVNPKKVAEIEAKRQEANTNTNE